ncbi:MAG: zinc-binding dehydrogenase [Phormidesmis sp.]
MQNNKPTFTSIGINVGVNVKQAPLQRQVRVQQFHLPEDAAIAAVAPPKQKAYYAESNSTAPSKIQSRSDTSGEPGKVSSKEPGKKTDERASERLKEPATYRQSTFELICPRPVQERSVQQRPASSSVPNSVPNSVAGAVHSAVSNATSNDLPVPHIGELLVRNRFVGISARFDPRLCQRNTPYAKSIFPSGLYFEAVGVVEAVGTAVTDFQVGDAVAVSRSSYIHEKYQIVKAGLAVKIQAATPEALTVLSAGVPAVIGLEQAGDIGTEGTVLITEAAKDVGHIAVQLAKLLGNYVIGTCGTAREEQLLKRLGCDRIVNYREENLEEVLSLEFPEGLHLVFDCVGKRMFDIGIHHLTRRGRFVVTDFGSESSELPTRLPRPRLYEKLFWRSASVQGFVLSHYHEFIPGACDRLLNLFYSNMLEVCVDPMIFKGVKSIPEAVDYLLSGRSCGKVVIRY